MMTPRWSSIRGLAQARIVTSMYLWLFVVPVLAQALSRLTGVARMNVFGHLFEVNLSLPFSWQIFYFSALCFTIGNVVFVLRCPSVIKDHRTASEFRAAGKGIDQIDAYSIDAQMPPDEYAAAKTQVEAHYKNNDERFHDLFWQVHAYADRQRLRELWLTSLLYAAGLALVAYVFVENLLVVIEHVG